MKRGLAGNAGAGGVAQTRLDKGGAGGPETNRARENFAFGRARHRDRVERSWLEPSSSLVWSPR
jgi:hypothetical protein